MFSSFRLLWGIFVVLSIHASLDFFFFMPSSHHLQHGQVKTALFRLVLFVSAVSTELATIQDFLRWQISILNSLDLHFCDVNSVSFCLDPVSNIMQLANVFRQQTRLDKTV